MEGRRTFYELTVDENLRAGAFTRSSKADVERTRAEVFELFPVLEKYRGQTAGYLSAASSRCSRSAAR